MLSPTLEAPELALAVVRESMRRADSAFMAALVGDIQNAARAHIGAATAADYVAALQYCLDEALANMIEKMDE